MNYTYKTNIYKMLLYIITKIIFLNITYYITFTFLLLDRVGDYYWVLDAIKKLYKFRIIPDLKIIITNANPSIIHVILEEFLLMSHLLCF